MEYLPGAYEVSRSRYSSTKRSSPLWPLANGKIAMPPRGVNSPTTSR